MSQDQDWISTGKAAKLLGYSRDHFREKFEGIIPSRRFLGGHIQWLEAAVRELAGTGVPLAS
jgi:hypothetical protein